MKKTQSPTTITVLAENTAARPGLGAEHGFCCWIESGEARILFDTGQTGLFARNAAELRIDVASANAIVLSHGHYDHTGGLREAMRLSPRARLFLHPAALEHKFGRLPTGAAKEIGMPSLAASDLRSLVDRVVMTATATEIADGLHVTGRIPRANNFEDTGGPFYLDSACTRPDPLDDDQALFFRSDRGIVVILGCAHAGVVNTINHIRALMGGWPIYAVIGGMHLRSASQSRLDATLLAFQEHDVQFLAPAHCTGSGPMKMIRQQFPNRYHTCQTGSQFSFS
jgi:7,8-dihydropterin-6-yl-methyl-4-(beta-D-ribofuranosyl)aminobenzene 5'-phosphate synthase